MRRLALALIGASLLVAPLAHAQFGSVPPAKDLVQISADKVVVGPGGRAMAQITLTVLKGWHINANPAADESSIPTEVTVESVSGLTCGQAVYPRPRIEKLSFSDQPLLVFDGSTVIQVPVSAAATAKPGTHSLAGVVRFQACNDQICLPPARLKFELVVEMNPAITAGLPGGAAPEGGPVATTPAPETGTPAAGGLATPETRNQLNSSRGFTTSPPVGGAGATSVAGGPLADVLNRGGWIAYLSLFLIGLALNLTPCVYPMIGVTVSIFGARRAAPPLQVFGSAVLYVLGMASMYSALGLVAAFTGGLFGGFLQSPIVLVGIGVLLIALSLSMFGLYEFNLPPAVLTHLGGVGPTGAIGIFASGLVVGVFAAPCIGPPIVALLGVVAARGDPWFGLSAFFTLAMGLGFPYLLLATFSNLISALPRSGEWMVWVKKVFGVILVAVGLNYVLLALAPKAAAWVVPVALILGGAYLGFLEKSGSHRKGFRALKWLTGAVGIIAGAAIIALTPTSQLQFEDGTRVALGSALKGETPVMIEFSAAWCVPCHEMDRTTFADRRVIAAARGFRAFRVDLTHYDSPESEEWRREYAIAGVPTVVFVAPGGSEVREARVEGVMPAEEFVQRMERVVALGRAASR